MSTFEGLPPNLFAFFADLGRNNSAEYWQQNKSRWERDVRLPMRALLNDLTDEFGPLRMFRPNRDLRFSVDKSPYKLWTGATSTSQAAGGIGYYLEVSRKRIVTGYGAMLMVPDQLRRFRIAIDDEKTGDEFNQLDTALTSRSMPLSPGAQQPLKTVPRGFPRDHPRITYLRWKGAALVQEWPVAEWMHTPEARTAILEVWRAAEPLKTWLTTNVAAHS